MYEYKIKLSYRIQNCATCPFRHEMMVYENMESQDKLNGVVNIMRRVSKCVLKEQSVLSNQPVESYNSDCPLKGNCTELSK